MYHPTNPILDFDAETEEKNRYRIVSKIVGQGTLLSLTLNLIGDDPKLKYDLHRILAETEALVVVSIWATTGRRSQPQRRRKLLIISYELFRASVLSLSDFSELSINKSKAEYSTASLLRSWMRV